MTTYRIENKKKKLPINASFVCQSTASEDWLKKSHWKLVCWHLSFPRYLAHCFLTKRRFSSSSLYFWDHVRLFVQQYRHWIPLFLLKDLARSQDLKRLYVFGRVRSVWTTQFCYSLFQRLSSTLLVLSFYGFMLCRCSFVFDCRVTLKGLITFEVQSLLWATCHLFLTFSQGCPPTISYQSLGTFSTSTGSQWRIVSRIVKRCCIHLGYRKSSFLWNS